MQIALIQAKDGRLHILGEMAKAMYRSREPLGEHAPRIEVMNIPVDKIREVIGTGGKVIREIVEKTGAKINIDDDGTIKIASSSVQVDRGGQEVDPLDRGRAGSRRYLRRHRCEGRRLRRLRELLRPKDGLVHISQLAPNVSPRPPTSSRKATRSGSSFSASTSAARCACR
jgi:polyribonucleotide nucleotidyltransferase